MVVYIPRHPAQLPSCSHRQTLLSFACSWRHPWQQQRWHPLHWRLLHWHLQHWHQPRSHQPRSHQPRWHPQRWRCCCCCSGQRRRPASGPGPGRRWAGPGWRPECRRRQRQIAGRRLPQRWHRCRREEGSYSSETSTLVEDHS